MLQFMKRRDLILTLVWLASSMIPGLGKAAEPCPPPRAGVAGGTTATTSCPTTASGKYWTNFASTENPISEGGKWVNGLAVGLDWSDVQTGSGNAYASRRVDEAGVGRYSDPIAHLSTSFITFAADQYAQGTVYRAAGYAPPDKHEVELLLRFEITAGNARGYEVLWSTNGHLAIVRWNGAVKSYTELLNIVLGSAANGDVLRAEIKGSVITVYKNGTLVATSPPNATWASGQPGIGFWPVPGTTIASYGWSDFEAGNL